jgi:PAS domain-containing protein
LPLLKLNASLIKRLSLFPSLDQYIEKDLGFILEKAQGMLKLNSLAERVPGVIWQYALAVVSVAAALVITNSLERYTTLRTPFFFLAIILSSWFGRIGPGLLAVGLSTLAVDHYFAPTASGPVSGVDGRPFIFLFSLSGLIACWISVQRRKAEEALKQARDELELKVEQRTAELQRINEELRAEIAERKNAEAALLSREAQLKQAQAVAHLGSYEVDVRTGDTRWSDEVFHILGLDPASGSLSPRVSSIASFILRIAAMPYNATIKRSTRGSFMISNAVSSVPMARCASCRAWVNRSGTPRVTW